MVTIFQLPQRFKLINGTSDFDAAIKILPFSGALAVASVACGALVSKLKVPSVYISLLGGVLQVIGYAFLGTARASATIENKVYGFQAIAALGCGLSYSSVTILVAFVVEERDAGKLISNLPAIRPW